MANTIYLNSTFGYREDTLNNWQTANPVLEKGEISFVRDGYDGKFVKIGDGHTPWNSLSFAPLPKGEKGEQGEKGIDGKDGADYVLTEADKEEIAGKAKPEIDQTYNPESENAQSGIAVKEALDKSNLKLIKTITLEEDVTDINVTFDKGLKEIALFMNVAFDTEITNQTLSARSNGGQWYMFCEILNLTTTKQFFYAHSKELWEKTWATINNDTLLSSIQGIGASVSNCRLVTTRRREDYCERYVKDLNIFVINRKQKLTAGSTVEIWGVEADENI